MKPVRAASVRPGGVIALLAGLCVWLGAATASAPAGAVDQTAVLAKRPPKLLSAFGFFDDMATRSPAAGVLPFAPSTPLFTDYAIKLRFVHVPAGAAAAYNPNEAFAFPPGSALIKTFAYPDGAGALRLVETRVLLRQEAGWQAWPYVWNEAQSDAELKVAGAKIPMEIETPDGARAAFTYAVPNRNQCKACHSVAGELAPIGAKSRHLNHDYAYADGPQNQLARWTEAGLLDGAPDPQAAPRAPDWSDETALLARRARAWLDINCAHCHRPEGPASNSGLFLDWDQQDRRALGVLKRPVAAGRGSGGLDFAIVPGAPDHSILVHRTASTEPGVMMPELGRSLADPRAVALLRDWIAAMRD